MAGAAMKAEYGPTLGQLLAPRWRAASSAARRAAIVAAAALVVLLAAAGLTLENAHYAYGGGPVSFSFGYRSLFRTTPAPGEYVRVQSHSLSGGAPTYVFAVAPLTLAPYSGESSAALPMYAQGYIRSLARSYAGFRLRGEGKTSVNGVNSGYDIFYTATVDGTPVYGRNVLLLPEGAGRRAGVAITILASSTASKQIRTPQEVATTGILLHPLKTFTFG